MSLFVLSFCICCLCFCCICTYLPCFPRGVGMVNIGAGNGRGHRRRARVRQGAPDRGTEVWRRPLQSAVFPSTVRERVDKTVPVRCSAEDPRTGANCRSSNSVVRASGSQGVVPRTSLRFRAAFALSCLKQVPVRESGGLAWRSVAERARDGVIRSSSLVGSAILVRVKRRRKSLSPPRLVMPSRGTSC